MLLAIWPRWFWDRIGWVVQGYLQSWTIQSGCVNSYLGDIPTYFATLHTGLPLSTGSASTKQVLFWSYVPSAGFTHKSGTNCRTVFTVPRQTPCVPRSINCSSTNHCLDLRYCCRLFDSSVISFPDLTMFLRRKYCYFALMLGCLSIQSSGVSQPMGTISQKCWLGYHPSIFVPQARPALAEETSASFLGEIGDFSPRIC